MPSSSSAPERAAAVASPRGTAPAGSGFAGLRVSDALAGRLARLGLHSARDLLFHLPLRYEDETRLTPVADLREGGAQQIVGEVIACEISFRPRRQLVARIRDASGVLVARWFNFYPSQQKQLAVGRRVRVFGEPRVGFFGIEMIHPRVSAAVADAPLPVSLTPVYPTTAGLGQARLRSLIDAALDRLLAAEPECVPADVCRELGLSRLDEALVLLHRPPPEVSLAALEERAHPAWRRMCFEELLVQQISLRRAYNARRARRAPVLSVRGEWTAALRATLPFALTGAQARACGEIEHDLAAPYPMQRLLQGDVGSGKTVVAALAMLRAAESGYQAALMAPTEILAEQHYLKLADWLTPLGVEVAWLSGSQGKRARAAAAEKLAAGETLLAVGTHALIEDPVVLPRLGLAVIDEQHRFGVRQRLELRDKGRAGTPHMLMMSATPIPRTLAMTHYADLDVSVLDELPPGRSPVVTRLVADGRREEIMERIRLACGEGRQAYWVCPLIEESEAVQLQAAQDTFEMLRTALPELRVALVHGRLRADEKSATMAAFAAGEIDVLVATTVIEVGVDVANASLMVIEHAERFGLSQLHQLRGRVGRGTAESVCILMFARPLSETARARLKVIYENSDGFAIAREDLHIRGPGEFVGARQSGVPMLRHADLERDQALIEPARALAERLLAHDPERAEAMLQRWLGEREGLLRA